jgi:hypothetical protein
MEELTSFAADCYVELVEELLDEIAPYRPWFSQQLGDDEALWRWEEQREPIIAWLVQCGIFMGMKTYQELLDRLEEFWMSDLLVDMVPPEVIDRLPIELLEMVQAGPKDAADHIRRVEKLHERKMATAQLPPPLPRPEPGEIGTGNPEGYSPGTPPAY